MKAPPVAVDVQLRLRDWTQLQTHLLWIYHGPPLTGFEGTYFNDESAAWLLTEGSVRVEGGGAEVQAGPGTWVFPPFGEDRRMFSEDAELISVRFQARWPDGRQLFEIFQPQSIPAAETKSLERISKRLLRVKQRFFPLAGNELPDIKMNLAQYLQLDTLAPEWLNAYSSAMAVLGIAPTIQRTMDPRVAKLRALIERLAEEAFFDEELCASMVELSRSQTIRLFTAEFGMTPRRYWEQRRLSFASGRLKRTKLPVKAIAFEMGFSNPSHFSNWFRKHAHFYPRDFRDLIRVTKKAAEAKGKIISPADEEVRQKKGNSDPKHPGGPASLAGKRREEK